jgi:transcriptional regulator with XRE-family HTH domain
MTQHQVAERLNISQVHVSNLENGKANPSLELLEKLTDLYGYNPYVLAYYLNSVGLEDWYETANYAIHWLSERRFVCRKLVKET